jgi:formamidopyrimidine-DNA glycosylase
MPELPEVETIVRALRQGGRGGESVVGRTIQFARVLWARTLAAPDLTDFETRMVGQQITAVSRRGKFLVLHLTHDVLLIHLRMTGDMRVEPHTGPDSTVLPFAPHDRLVIIFEDQMRLVFNDARKFGRVWLVSQPDQVTRRLGPEPLDSGFTVEQLYQALQKRPRRQIKPLLLDQAFLAGLGNIYTDEALFFAGIHPLRLAGSLSPEQVEALWRGIRHVLEEGIRRNGASFDWVYRGGKFEFQVYQRGGQPCVKCGGVIVKSTVGQRGTHFCPTCQPE